jgi:hypothetical protein
MKRQFFSEIGASEREPKPLQESPNESHKTSYAFARTS